MAFIQNSEHLQNFITSIYREYSDSLDESLLMNIQSYYPLLFPEGLVDKFTWELKSNPKLLQEPDFWQWLKSNKPFPYTIPKYTEILFSSDFLDRIRSLDNIPGVYSFWSQHDDPLYVGVSVNLLARITSSFAERFRAYKNVMYCRILVTQTYSDARVLESYFISKLKPVFNSTGCHSDELTIKIVPEPNLGDRILCNEIPPAKVMEDFKPKNTRFTYSQSVA